MVRQTDRHTYSRMTVGFYKEKNFINIQTVCCEKLHSIVDPVTYNIHHP